MHALKHAPLKAKTAIRLIRSNSLLFFRPVELKRFKMQRCFSSIFEATTGIKHSNETQDKIDEVSKPFKFRVIDYYDSEYEIEAYEGELLIDAGSRSGVPFSMTCGKIASCTTCHCLLPIEALLHKEYEVPREIEQDTLDSLSHFTLESRLACQLQLKRSVFEGKTIRFTYTE